MRNIIAQLIANKLERKINLEGDGELVIDIDEGFYKVYWLGEGWQFDIYSDGYYVWESVDENGNSIDFKEGYTIAPHNRRWLKTLFNLDVYPEIAQAAVYEWRAILNKGV